MNLIDLTGLIAGVLFIYAMVSHHGFRRDSYKAITPFIYTAYFLALVCFLQACYKIIMIIT